MPLTHLDAEKIVKGGIDFATALEILECSEEEYFAHVLPIAKKLRESVFGNQVSFCSITNAKSGACTEDCKFCSQSSHYATDAPLYGIKSASQIVLDAQEAAASGATEFSIVTSGRGMSKERELEIVADAISQIRESTPMETCASLGLMTQADLARLKEAGMVNYHHNIETSRSFFPQIVTTHSFDEEVASLKAAREVGLKICCGGIMGMGESLEQRVEFAFNLKEISPDSIPLNFLNPRPGTPLGDVQQLTPLDCLKIISVMRLVMPRVELFVCGGREVNLKDWQDKIFDAGASGTMLGNYLTTKGRAAEDDRRMIQSLGLEVIPPHSRDIPRNPSFLT